MIPAHMKSRARWMVVASLGILLAGVAIGAAWVVTYMPR
jgi:hypothetical protein